MTRYHADLHQMTCKPEIQPKRSSPFLLHLVPTYQRCKAEHQFTTEQRCKTTDSFPAVQRYKQCSSRTSKRTAPQTTAAAADNPLRNDTCDTNTRHALLQAKQRSIGTPVTDSVLPLPNDRPIKNVKPLQQHEPNTSGTTLKNNASHCDGSPLLLTFQQHSTDMSN
jgi:hypothetical protein